MGSAIVYGYDPESRKAVPPAPVRLRWAGGKIRLKETLSWTT